MKKIRTLLVDDEPIATRGMLAMLRQESDVEIIGTCEDGAEAVTAIQKLQPDLVFLDIQMPGLGGFDVVREVGVGAMPPVVFVTAYDQHAVCAFEVEALDYILKPVDPARLRLALERYRRINGHWPESLAIKQAGKVTLVNVGDISHISAAGNYIDVFSAGRPAMLRETLSSIAARLDPSRFLRISRSTLVHTSHVAGIETSANGDFKVHLKDQTVLIGSRRYRDQLKKFPI
jgi:two-component system LytT family response regulator